MAKIPELLDGHVTLEVECLDAMLRVVPQKVEAQAVIRFLDFTDQARPQPRPLRGVHQAFENGVLNPLAEVLAKLRHVAQTPPSLLILRAHIVCHNHKHH
jgi:hypothetical protein